MITFIWLTFEPILPMIPGFNRMSYLRDMENMNLDKAAVEYADAHPFVYNSKVAAFKAGATWQEQQPITEEQFKQYVVRELDSCGYFMADLDADFIQKINPDWKPYSSKSFGEMLLDFACQWNMEHGGKDYEYKLKED